MPNFEFARNVVFSRADTGYYPMKSSATIYLGDPLVLTTVDSGKMVVRSVATGDVSSLTNGLIGFSAVNAVTDSSGIQGAQIVPSGVSGAAAITYNIPQYGFGLAADSGSTRNVVRVIMANGTNEFWGKVLAGSQPATVAAAEALIGLGAGLNFASATDITIDQNTSNAKCFVISGYDPNDLTRVKFRVKSTYRQQELGTTYSS